MLDQPNKKPIILYDGDCPMCKVVISTVGGDNFHTHKLQSDEQVVQQFDKTDLKKEIHVIDKEGKVRRGADGMFEIANQYWWGKPLAFVGRLPGFRQLSQGVYGIVAKNRYALFIKKESMKSQPLTLLAVLSMVILGVVGFNFLRPASDSEAENVQPVASVGVNASVVKGEIKKAYFAGGCFWCVESDFEKLDGVIEVVSGFTGGTTDNPTYKEVSTKETGHIEAVEVQYDSGTISYQELLDHFWRHVNPTDAGGQFVDRGYSYTTGIFYTTDEEKGLAVASKNTLDEKAVFDDPIVTPVYEFDQFYSAEEYHQDYYKKNPNRYKVYRFGSGRDQFLNKIWKN